LDLFAREWRPEQMHRAVVCVVHGLGEHGGRYVQVAEELAKKGFALMAVDLRGHGRSDGKRGHTPSYRAALDDIDALLEGAAERHPGLPRFLYGHSWGGNLVLNHVLRRKGRVSGVVATSPWLRLTHEPNWFKTLLGSIIEPIRPSWTMTTTSDRKEILGDAGPRQEAEATPLSHDQITLRLFMGARRAGRWAVNHAQQLTVPTLLIHGADDPVTDPRASAKFAAKAGPLCTIDVLANVAHNPHEEDESTVRKIADWVAARLTPDGSHG
jgi:alpha-beta hydrolase superfamily lysophospholipase